jgi:hypothetical protein
MVVKKVARLDIMEVSGKQLPFPRTGVCQIGLLSQRSEKVGKLTVTPPEVFLIDMEKCDEHPDLARLRVPRK